MQELFSSFPTEESCVRHIVRARFGDVRLCEGCGDAAGIDDWKPVGRSRLLKHSCGKAISPIAGTLFGGTRIPLTLWFYALLHFANSLESVNAIFLSRHLGVGVEAASRMISRIREHIALVSYDDRLGGLGKTVNVHIERCHRVKSPGRFAQNRATLLVLADDSSVQSTVMCCPQRQKVAQVLKNKLQAGSRVLTTCHHTYHVLTQYGRQRPLVEFDPAYFVENRQVEDLRAGFLMHFRPPLRTQHNGVSAQHFWLYVKEYEFRYNRRFAGESIFPDLVARCPAHDCSSIERARSWNHFSDG